MQYLHAHCSAITAVQQPAQSLERSVNERRLLMTVKGVHPYAMGFSWRMFVPSDQYMCQRMKIMIKTRFGKIID